MLVESLLDAVLESVKPSAQEFREELRMAESIMGRIKAEKGAHVGVMLGGSLGRNTHLRNDRDIDLFVIYPKHLPRKEFEREGLRLGRKIMKGHFFEEAFSEHPYLRGSMNGFDVEIVPAFDVESADRKQSSVDRSRFHTHYLNERLHDQLRDEVRLLKQFLKGIECYGADVKASSVPGYVVELLVLHYGRFLDAIKAVSAWKQEQVIDLQKYWPVVH